MVAVICLLIPSLVLFLIDNILNKRQESRLNKIIRWLIYVIVLNGVIWIILRLFFTLVDRPIYNLNHDWIFACKYLALSFILITLYETVRLCIGGIYKKFENQVVFVKEKLHPYIIQLHAIIFIIILATTLWGVNFIAQPIWTSSNNYDMMSGFYEEPENTIETILLGPSHMRCAISPMELYEKFGICSYNISTNAQPVLSSYFWLEETYRLHADTLNTVIFDVEMVKKNSDSAANHLALDYMQLSIVKLNAVKAYSKDFTDFIFNLIPLFNYHERWKELTDQDFLKYDYKPELCIRGYQYGIPQWVNYVSKFSDINIPLYITDSNAKGTELNETSLEYLKKIVEFCEERDIRLILIKTPTYWNSSDHNAIQLFADIYGLDFFDFNTKPYFDDINFNMATDELNTADITNLHLNYYGALKLTDYIGNYLINECSVSDIRSNDKYSFMEEELKEYHRYIASARLQQYTDPCDYLEYALDQGNYTVLISVKDEASDALTNEQRNYFSSIGLERLSKLTNRASYLAVIENGEIKTEMFSSDPGDKNKTNKLIEYEGVLPDGIEYTVVSGGYNQGNKSSIIIDETEYSGNNRGLNIVLYDNIREEYIDKANFDTHISPQREIQNVEIRLATRLADGVSLSELIGSDRNLYLYNRRCENDKNVKLIRLSIEDNDLISYLDHFLGDKDLDIYISVKNDAARSMTSNLRDKLAERKLDKLTKLAYQDSYIALISGGNIIFEESGRGKDAVEMKTEKYYLMSGGARMGDNSSIMIDGKEYSPNEDGINIVVYDNITEMVIDTNSFDTGNINQIIPEETAA